MQNEAFLLALMKGHTDSVKILHKRRATTLNTAEVCVCIYVYR